MGATLSKMWGAFMSAWTGGGSPGKNHQNSTNGHDIDIENGLPTTNTPTKPPTPLPNMGQVKKYEITEPWIRWNCSLGEGPFYEENTNTVRFVDVEKLELHRADLKGGATSHKVFKKLDISIGVTADIEGNDDEFIFGGKYGYGICNKQSGDYRWIKKVWSDEEIAEGKPDRMRGNDGSVDSKGRFWVGFMNDPLVKEPTDEGAFFRLDPDLSLHRPLDHKITIPNGTTWNKSGDTMFYTESPSKTIYKLDYDLNTGAVSNRRPYFTMPEDNRYGEDAVPDGHVLDVENHMWTALHGGSHVLRISPEGEIVAEIKVPTLQPTCPAFCGEELVITSAGGTSGPDGKGVDEFAGSVFKIHVGVKGTQKNKFKFTGGSA